jgi:hypothetical protein
VPGQNRARSEIGSDLKTGFDDFRAVRSGAKVGSILADAIAERPISLASGPGDCKRHEPTDQQYQPVLKIEFAMACSLGTYRAHRVSPI